MHETAFYNRLVLQHSLITITALETLLIPVAVMSAVLHTLEVPYHAEFAHCCDEVTLLFTILSDLKDNIKYGKNTKTNRLNSYQA
jgi:hypothetical protein